MIKLRKQDGVLVADVRVRLASGQVVRQRMQAEGTRAEATRWAEEREQYVRAVLDAWYRDRVVRGERLTGREIREALRSGVTPPPPAAKQTTGQYLDRWLEERKKRDLSSWRDDESKVRRYIKLLVGAVPLDELRPSHIRAMVEQLKVTDSTRGGKMAPRSIRATFRLVRQALSDALVDGLIATNPAILKHGDLPVAADKPGFDRQAQFYEPEEVAALIRDPRIPEYRRVSHAMSFLTGLRSSEEAALRFADVEWEAKPLPRIVAKKAWSRGRERDTTKTHVDKWVPVHPALLELLTRWWLTGWERMYGRAPKPTDYILPSPTCADAPRDAGYALKSLRRSLRLLGLPEKRRKHDARSFLDSWATACGAPEETVKLVTHPRPTCAFDGYKRLRLMWGAMCAAIAGIKLPGPGGGVVAEVAVPVEAAIGQEAESPAVAEA